MDITGNTILITGGSSGIGFEMARQFLQKDNKVIITGRNEQKLQEAKRQLDGVTAIRNDAANPEDAEKLCQRIATDFPGLNILVNNAGVMRTINLQDSDRSAMELTGEIDINLKGTLLMNKVFLPLLKRNSNPAIVNVSSGLAFTPLPVAPVYSASKAAIHSYTLSLRTQLRNTGIRVFELVPPLTQTGLIGAFAEEDIKGVPIMPVEDMVTAFLKGLAKDQYEICVGQAGLLRFLSRFFPDFILRQMSKSVDRIREE